MIPKTIIRPYDVINSLKENISKESLKSTWLCGGAALEQIKEHLGNFDDYDLFFETKEAFDEFNIYLQLAGFVEYTSPNAITYTFKGETVQLIHKSFEPIHDILNTFDLRNCMIAIPMSSANSIVDLRLGAKKQLILNEPKNTSLDRIFKYIIRGYTISDDDIKQIVSYYKEGVLNPLYREFETNNIDNIRHYFSSLIEAKNTQMVRVIFEIFPEEGWLKDALFATNRNFVRLLTAENRKYTVSRLQELAIEVNLGNYDAFKDEIRETYPEYFISGERIYNSRQVYRDRIGWELVI
jgi:hypothetical protein